MRKDEAKSLAIENIYFGGGTPSLCNNDEITRILNTVFEHYEIVQNPEITLEANPDDLLPEKIIALSESPINRLSIGVQSFFEEDLTLMNRAHNAHEALESIKLARHYFDNISADLIYGIPNMSLDRWNQNIDTILKLNIPHISCYALTVEENTALEKLIATGKIAPTNDSLAAKHYQHLVKRLESEGYINYEFSNFGKPDYFSRNNTNYWQGKPYIGIGPSAHSFDGTCRSWNITNNIKYFKAIENDILPSEKEILTITDRYNEYIMTGLRTQWGISKSKIESDFGLTYRKHLEKESRELINQELIIEEKDHYHLTPKGKFLGDGISSKLFFVD